MANTLPAGDENVMLMVVLEVEMANMVLSL